MGIPHDLEQESKSLKIGHLAFWWKSDIMVQVWKDKRLVRIISMIHAETIVNIGRKDRKTSV
jgi:hypothetical protein